MLQNSFITLFTSKNASIYAYNTVFLTHVKIAIYQFWNFTPTKKYDCPCMCIGLIHVINNHHIINYCINQVIILIVMTHDSNWYTVWIFSMSFVYRHINFKLCHNKTGVHLRCQYRYMFALLEFNSQQVCASRKTF